MLKTRRSEINRQSESDFRNWRFCHVTINFRNVDSPFEEFSASSGFLRKIFADDAENERKFGLVNLKRLLASSVSESVNGSCLDFFWFQIGPQPNFFFVQKIGFREKWNKNQFWRKFVRWRNRFILVFIETSNCAIGKELDPRMTNRRSWLKLSKGCLCFV